MSGEFRLPVDSIGSLGGGKDGGKGKVSGHEFTSKPT